MGATVLRRGPARILTSQTKTLTKARPGYKGVLECSAHGVPPPDLIEWSYDGLILSSTAKYQITQETKDDTHKSTLTISNVGPADFGFYNCTVTNDLGGAFIPLELRQEDSPLLVQTVMVSLAVVTLIVITLLLLLLFWRSWRKNKVVVSREKNSEDEVDSDSDYSSYQPSEWDDEQSSTHFTEKTGEEEARSRLGSPSIRGIGRTPGAGKPSFPGDMMRNLTEAVPLSAFSFPSRGAAGAVPLGRSFPHPAGLASTFSRPAGPASSFGQHAGPASASLSARVFSSTTSGQDQRSWRAAGAPPPPPPPPPLGGSRRPPLLPSSLNLDLSSAKSLMTARPPPPTHFVSTTDILTGTQRLATRV